MTKEQVMNKSIKDITDSVTSLIYESKFLKEDMNEKWSNIQSEIKDMKLLLAERVASKEYVDTKFASLDQKYSPTKTILTWAGIIIGGSILTAVATFLVNGGFGR